MEFLDKNNVNEYVKEEVSEVLSILLWRSESC
jgi:hypothetical protein